MKGRTERLAEDDNTVLATCPECRSNAIEVVVSGNYFRCFSCGTRGFWKTEEKPKP